jgi:hypothetical protein
MGYLPPRVLQILLAIKNIPNTMDSVFVTGTTRPNGEAILKFLRDNTPRASRFEAWSDTNGLKCVMPIEMVGKFLANTEVDLDNETKETRDGLRAFFWDDYMSTMDTGALQNNLNGDGRSVLAEASPFRAGYRCKGGRYVSDDPDAVIGLNLVRFKRVETAARRAQGTVIMTTGRQPKLTSAILGHLATTKANVDMLLSPPPDTTPALAAPNEPQPGDSNEATT